jgi:hypothetical protein
MIGLEFVIFKVASNFVGGFVTLKVYQTTGRQVG